MKQSVYLFRSSPGPCQGATTVKITRTSETLSQERPHPRPPHPHGQPGKQDMPRRIRSVTRASFLILMNSVGRWDFFNCTSHGTITAVIRHMTGIPIRSTMYLVIPVHMANTNHRQRLPPCIREAPTRSVRPGAAGS